MAKKVKALQTIAGEYGKAFAGDEIVVRDRTADQLAKAGLVEVLGDAEDETVSVASKGSVRFTDETRKQDAPAGETDEANPTGKDLPVKKAAAPKTGKR